MKILNLVLSLIVITGSTSAFAYETCSTTNEKADNASLYLNIETDAGQVEAAVISVGGTSYNFYPSHSFYSLDPNASQSPGFSKVSVSHHVLSVYQKGDTGRGEWISYLCR